MSDPVRVVVAEGPSTRKGLLRFVLEGEGYDVVGDAATSAELARVVALHRPDVVVMDDGIGAMAVAMIRDDRALDARGPGVARRRRPDRR